MPLKPMEAVPDLDIETVGGPHFTLSEHNPEIFTLLVFYRGHHCPICKTWLGDLDGLMPDFISAGVDVLALSCDNGDQAARSHAEWALEQVPIGYGLPISAARKWGLYISRSIKEEEPREFAEPGIFLVRPDRTLYAGMVSSMPFARPHFEDILGAIRFIAAKGYPPRGEA